MRSHEIDEKSSKDPREVIDKAMREDYLVYIVYRNLQQHETQRHIQPIEWMDANKTKIKAFCFSANEERTFLIASIKEISLAVKSETSPSKGNVSSFEQWKSSQASYSEINQKPSQEKTPQFNLENLISKLSSRDDWKHLIHYYAECLNREYLQTYVIDYPKNEKDYFFFSNGEDLILRFMAGGISLDFQESIDKQRTEIAEFILGPQKREKQLCLGYPFITSPDGRMVPLFFVRCEIKEADGKIRLIADDYELSYAILSLIDLDKEVFSELIRELTQLEFDDVTLKLKRFQDAIIAKLEEVTANPLRRYEQNRPHIRESLNEVLVLSTPCLFWATKNNITGALIEELDNISQQPWASIPETLLALFNQTKSEAYPPEISLANDSQFYVTAVNQEQRRATDASLNMPVTVVTGPPGTGKSQLVLNIIANAVIEGKSVLFASRNNGAVDVVVKRMRDIGFDGFVRVGNASTRKDAAESMLDAFAKAARPHKTKDYTLLVEQYKKHKLDLVNQYDKLKDIQKQKAVLLNKNQELETKFADIPTVLAETLKDSKLSANSTTMKALKDTANALIRFYETLQQRISNIEKLLQEYLSENVDQNPLISAIEDFETEWGSFGDGIRRIDQFLTIESLQIYIRLWLQILDAVEAQTGLHDVTLLINQQESLLEEKVQVLPSVYQIKIDANSKKLSSDAIAKFGEAIERANKRFKHIKQTAQEKVAETTLGAKVQSTGKQQAISFIKLDEQSSDTNALLNQVQEGLVQVVDYLDYFSQLQELTSAFKLKFLYVLPDTKVPSNPSLEAEKIEKILATVKRQVVSIRKKHKEALKPSLSNFFGLFRRGQAKQIFGAYKSLLENAARASEIEVLYLLDIENLLNIFKNYLLTDMKASQVFDKQYAEFSENILALTSNIQLNLNTRNDVMSLDEAKLVADKISSSQKQIKFLQNLDLIEERKKEFNLLSSSLLALLDEVEHIKFALPKKLEAVEIDIFNLRNFIDAVQAMQELTLRKQELELKQNQLSNLLSPLPEQIKEDLPRLPIQSSPQTTLRSLLEEVEQEIESMFEQQKLSVSSFGETIQQNSTFSKLWQEFQIEVGKDDYPNWSLDSEISLGILQAFVRQWLFALDIVEIKSQIEQLEQKIRRNGGEEEARQRVSEAEELAIKQASDILNNKWLQNIDKLDPARLQSVIDYASLMREVAEDYDYQKYRRLMSKQDSEIDNIIATFPVWATTNLSISRNIPLRAKLFDIVIIDEASQCDIPSALPLIYRAKQVIVIGDAMQLRHIATLADDVHLAIAAENNIETGAYSYIKQSLFDLGTRSVLQSPGVLMLKEHYRSHENIINFSNKAFYDGKLIIKTDMHQRKIPMPIIDKGAGIFWFNVSGETIHPNSGSAKNIFELSALKQVLPAIYKRLEVLGWKASIGVVTPYREQKSVIDAWVTEQFGDKITVGTAHTFQGDEREILLFSTVLARKISEGSLAWLRRNDNLLNVAITRAKTTLIIIGDFNYCMSLPENNPYRLLADYVREKPNGIIQSWEDLPLLT